MRDCKAEAESVRLELARRLAEVFGGTSVGPPSVNVSVRLELALSEGRKTFPERSDLSDLPARSMPSYHSQGRALPLEPRQAPGLLPIALGLKLGKKISPRQAQRDGSISAAYYDENTLVFRFGKPGL